MIEDGAASVTAISGLRTLSHILPNQNSKFKIQNSKFKNPQSSIVNQSDCVGVPAKFTHTLFISISNFPAFPISTTRRQVNSEGFDATALDFPCRIKNLSAKVPKVALANIRPRLATNKYCSPQRMKSPLKLKKPSLHTRAFFAVAAVFIVCFSTAFVFFPVRHLLKELLAGNIRWDLIGLASIGVPFGLFMLWNGFGYRVWVLPYQFTVDFGEKTCGYFWKGNWVGRVDLTGVEALIAAPAWSQHNWPWIIYARFGGERERKAILNSHTGCSTEFLSFERCYKTCATIATYLEVPVEFDEWSPEVVSARKQDEQ